MDCITIDEFIEIILSNYCSILKCSHLFRKCTTNQFRNYHIILNNDAILIEDNVQCFSISKKNIRVINITRRLVKTLMCITYFDGSYVEVVLNLKRKEK